MQFFCYLESSYSFYLTYITSLNYLDTNLYYILLFCSFFTPIFWSIFFFIKSIVTITSYSQLIVFKKLLTSLIVGTVLIHPAMFYILLLLFLFKIYFSKIIEILLQNFLNQFTLLVLLGITMFLGGFWSTQSDSWGYFWVNDLIEWYLLSIIIFLIRNLHKLLFNFFFYNCSLIFTFLISFLILIRIGFFSTRHNFIGLSLSTYRIYFFYISVFYTLGRLFFSNFFYKSIFYTNFFYFIFIINYSYSFKFLMIYYILTYFTVISFIRQKVYFHYFFNVFIVAWLLPFIFFKTFNSYLVYLNLDSLTIFYSIFLNNFTVSFQNFFIENLSCVNFIISFFNYNSIILFKSKLTLLLNNFQLIYLFFSLFIFFFWKIGWI